MVEGGECWFWVEGERAVGAGTGVGRSTAAVAMMIA